MHHDPLKPGDLALVFRTVHPLHEGCFAHAVGAVVQVEQRAQGKVGRLIDLGGITAIEWHHFPSWMVREPHCCRCCGAHLFGFPEAVLRKLPEPGDVDEHDREQERREADQARRTPQPEPLTWE